jgi:two-component system sensor histidine kinase AlgZ
MLVIGTELLALILSLAHGFSGSGFLARLLLVSAFSQGLVLSSMAVLCVMHKKLTQMKALRAAIIAYVVILSFTLILSLLVIQLDASIGLPNGKGLVPNFVISNLVICAIVTMLVLRYFYLQHRLITNTEAEAHARVQALQARIRPHFLFNSMNTIASLTRSDPYQAERAVEDLADLFRVSLAEKNNLTLKEELNVTERYLAIEAHRLGNRLEVQWEIDENIDWYTEVPALVLQPLVENALYHGIEPLTEGGTVSIILKNIPGFIEVSVANPLSQKSDQQRHKGNQMAQENIRQRLLLEYGEEGKLDIQTKDGQYVVSFKIPR